MATLLQQAATVRDKAKGLYEQACRKAGKMPEKLAGPAAWQPAANLDGLIRQGEEVTIQKALDQQGPAIRN